MATTREIRRRMRSIGNITQITRAMEMVSAAKMRRATERAQASRAYADRIRTVIAGLSGLTDIESERFPLLVHRPIERMTVILLTSNKGLAGALNSNVIRRSVELVRAEPDRRAEIVAVGRKGRDFYRRTNYPLAAEFINLQDWPTIEDLRPIVDIAIADYTRGRTDAVYLVYTEFVSTLIQRPQVRQLLPIVPEFDEDAEEQIRDFIFEPSREEVLEALLPRYIEVQVYQSVIDALASEHAARMVAMRNATENANELLDDLTLSFNKARQAQITAEVSEIATAAVALGTG